MASQLQGTTGTTMNGSNDSSMSGNPFQGSVALTNNATTAGTMHKTISGSIGTMGLTKSGLANYNANHYHQHNSHNMLHGQHANGYGATSTSTGVEEQQQSTNCLGGPNPNNRTATASAMLTGGPSAAPQSVSAMAIGMLNNAGQHQHLSSQMHMPSSTNENTYASQDKIMMHQQQDGSKLPNGNGSPTQRIEQHLVAQDRGASAQQIMQEKWYEVKRRNYQNDPGPGVPAEPHMFIDPTKPRKQFEDYYYDTKQDFIDYPKTFDYIIKHYSKRINSYGIDEKLLNDVIVQLMKPLETDRPFEAFNLVWHFLKWLRQMQVEIKTKLFTLIIRSFEKCHEPAKYHWAMLDIYKRLPARNSHATAAMIKAHGVAQDVGQCVEYLKQYKMLPKHDSNKRFNFVVYQAALDASILHLRNKHRRLEAMARRFIYEEYVSQCDEPMSRRKIDPTRNPRQTHPHLSTPMQHNCSYNKIAAQQQASYGDSQQCNSGTEDAAHGAGHVQGAATGRASAVVVPVHHYPWQEQSEVDPTTMVVSEQHDARVQAEDPTKNSNSTTDTSDLGAGEQHHVLGSTSCERTGTSSTYDTVNAQGVDVGPCSSTTRRTLQQQLKFVRDQIRKADANRKGADATANRLRDECEEMLDTMAETNAEIKRLKDKLAELEDKKKKDNKTFCDLNMEMQDQEKTGRRIMEKMNNYKFEEQELMRKIDILGENHQLVFKTAGG
ncbi:unnamed protein product [Amoebophrya sp. A120]|nr:unnamed protein product [Amoebophrya sp. A120]|eukprot:GSA120T00002561001.1